MKPLSFIASVSIALMLAGCTKPEPSVRQYQLVLIATNKKSLLEILSATAEEAKFSYPFSAQGKCPAAIWVPRISVVALADLSAPDVKPVSLGLLDPEKLTSDSQNSIQKLFKQSPTLIELQETAAKSLMALELPAGLLSQQAVVEVGAVADPRKAMQRFAGRLGVSLYKDESAKPDSALPNNSSVSLKNGSGPSKLPDKPVPFSDVESFRQQIHDFFCALPPDSASQLPTVVALGVAGDIKRPVELPPVPAAGASGPPPDSAVAAAAPMTADAVRAFDRGLGAARAQDYKLALKEFSFALKVQPGYAAAIGARGVAYMRLKQYVRAEEDMREAIRLNPTSYPNRYNLAALYSLRSDAERGLLHLDEALERGFAVAKNENGDTERELLKFDARGDPDFAFLRKNRSDYCAVLEKHKIQCQN